MPDILILPPHRKWAPWTTPPDTNEPDREKPFRILRDQGITFRRIDPFPWPLNPFARAHGVLLAIDPLRALRVLLFHRQTRLVLCYYESASLLILLFRKLFAFRARIAVFDVGTPGGWRLRNAILRRVLPRADALRPLGTAQIAGLIALGARPETVRVMLTATSPDFFTAAPDQPDGYILAVGDDISRDYPTLLAAAAQLDRKLIIRSSAVRPGDITAANITLLTGSLSSREYRDLIANAALVVLPLRPSVHAGGVTTLLEAMSSAKAVIVSRSPGLADYTATPGTCRLVPPEDAAALRDAITSLLTDHAARQAMGQAARAYILAECGDEAMAARHLQLLNEA
jgi:glycosyltransferase involved in cell wall biosynthesis